MKRKAREPTAAAAASHRIKVALASTRLAVPLTSRERQTNDRRKVFALNLCHPSGALGGHRRRSDGASRAFITRPSRSPCHWYDYRWPGVRAPAPPAPGRSPALRPLSAFSHRVIKDSDGAGRRRRQREAAARSSEYTCCCPFDARPGRPPAAPSMTKPDRQSATSVRKLSIAMRIARRSTKRPPAAGGAALTRGTTNKDAGALGRRCLSRNASLPAPLIRSRFCPTPVRTESTSGDVRA